MKKEKIKLKLSKDDEDVAYVYLPEHPKVTSKGLVKRQVRLFDLIKNYKGPDIYLDFDKNNHLIGIEILS